MKTNIPTNMAYKRAEMLGPAAACGEATTPLPNEQERAEADQTQCERPGEYVQAPLWSVQLKPRGKLPRASFDAPTGTTLAAILDPEGNRVVLVQQ